MRPDEHLGAGAPKVFGGSNALAPSPEPCGACLGCTRRKEAEALAARAGHGDVIVEILGGTYCRRVLDYQRNQKMEADKAEAAAALGRTA
jgi:hypothetical protein